MKKKLQLREGAYYRTRAGRTVGPLLRSSHPLFPFTAMCIGETLSWTATGFWSVSGETNLDIVAECTQNENDHTQKQDETELERLVRVANRAAREYLDAFQLLHDKYATQVYASGGPPDITHLGPNSALTNPLRIKPRPAFPEFYVAVPPNGHAKNPGWLVRLSDDGGLFVGCQRFDPKWALTTLRGFCGDDDFAATAPNGIEMRSCKSGIYFGLDLLSWADADRLLAALEAYFKTTTEAA